MLHALWCGRLFGLPLSSTCFKPQPHCHLQVRMDVADSGGIEELTFQMDRPMLDKMLGALQTIQGRIEVAPG